MFVRQENTNKQRRVLRCTLKLNLTVLRVVLAAITPFFVATQLITWLTLKSRPGFLFGYLCSAISSIAGLFHFADQGRITPVNRPLRPAGSFIQDVPRSFSLFEVVNHLKTFYTGLMGLRLLADTQRHPGNGEAGAVGLPGYNKNLKN